MYMSSGEVKEGPEEQRIVSLYFVFSSDELIREEN
jgi:hypothetical protein